MEAESYGDDATAAFVNQSFVPYTVNIKEHPTQFHRFDVLWTPAVLVMDPNGVERYRIEGYLPNREFHAQLEMALARVAFTRKQWADAEQRYAAIAEKLPDTTVAADAIYWRAVCHYKGTNDHTVLGPMGQELAERYPKSLAALKAIPFVH